MSHREYQQVKFWDLEEETRLLKRFRDGMTISQLSAIHARSKASIQARLTRLGAMVETKTQAV